MTGWTWEYVDELVLPQVYVLFGYWAKWPPTHEATRLAWFKVDDGTAASAGEKRSGDSGDVGSFFAMNGVSSEWRGPPPMKIADVIALAERAKRNG